MASLCGLCAFRVCGAQLPLTTQSSFSVSLPRPEELLSWGRFPTNNDAWHLNWGHPDQKHTEQWRWSLNFTHLHFRILEQKEQYDMDREESLNKSWLRKIHPRRTRNEAVRLWFHVPVYPRKGQSQIVPKVPATLWMASSCGVDQ